VSNIEIFDVTLSVIGILEQLGVRYELGGSLASSLHGTPRSTLDADIVADLRAADVQLFRSALAAFSRTKCLHTLAISAEYAHSFDDRMLTRRRLHRRGCAAWKGSLMKTLWMVSLALALAMAMAMAMLAGCGAKPANTGAAGKTGDVPASSGGDTLAKIKKAGVIKWGADRSGGAPFVFTDPADPSGERITGFEVEIMEKLAHHMGVKAQLVSAQWDGLLDDMNNMRSDIVVNGYEIVPKWQAKADFSQAYFVYDQQLTVRAEDKEKYKKLADLKGKQIGTLSGAAANEVVKEKGFSEDQIKQAPDSQSPYDDLKLKRVDGVVQEGIIAAHYAGKDAACYNVPETFAAGKYGVAARKGDKALLDEINKILSEMKKNGELAAIYKKWNMLDAKQKEIGIESK